MPSTKITKPDAQQLLSASSAAHPGDIPAADRAMTSGSRAEVMNARLAVSKRAFNELTDSDKTHLLAHGPGQRRWFWPQSWRNHPKTPAVMIQDTIDDSETPKSGVLYAVWTSSLGLEHVQEARNATQASHQMRGCMPGTQPFAVWIGADRYSDWVDQILAPDAQARVAPQAQAVPAEGGQQRDAEATLAAATAAAGDDAAAASAKAETESRATGQAESPSRIAPDVVKALENAGAQSQEREAEILLDGSNPMNNLFQEEVEQAMEAAAKAMGEALVNTAAEEKEAAAAEASVVAAPEAAVRAKREEIAETAFKKRFKEQYRHLAGPLGGFFGPVPFIGGHSITPEAVKARAEKYHNSATHRAYKAMTEAAVAPALAALEAEATAPEAAFAMEQQQATEIPATTYATSSNFRDAAHQEAGRSAPAPAQAAPAAVAPALADGDINASRPGGGCSVM